MKWAKSSILNEADAQGIDTKDPFNEFVHKFTIDTTIIAGILIFSGYLQLEYSVISLCYMVRSNNVIVPALAVNEGATAIITQCEFKGNKTHLTVGALVKQANLIMTDSKIHGFKAGGILVESKLRNKISILKSKIVFNEIVGVHVTGEDSIATIEQNNIENNVGPGVKIGIACTTKVIKNIIKLN